MITEDNSNFKLSISEKAMLVFILLFWAVSFLSVLIPAFGSFVVSHFYLGLLRLFGYSG